MAFIAEDLAATTNVDGKTRQTIAPRLLARLQKIAEQRVPITYQELAKALGLVPPNAIHQMTEALEHLMAEDAATDRPFIAAIAISKARGASRPQGSSIAPGGSDALPAMRKDLKPGPSMRVSSTPRSRSGRRRQPLVRAGKDAWTFIRRKPRPRPN
jgi:hypothetical protein